MQHASTKTDKTTSLATPISELGERFQRWRSTRSPGERIPEELWNAATQLARVHGVCPVSVPLKLNYYDLQRRMGGVPRKSKLPPIQPTFVELPSTPGVTYPQVEGGTVELIRSNGSRLTLRLSHPKARDLLPLVQAFLRS